MKRPILVTFLTLIFVGCSSDVVEPEVINEPEEEIVVEEENEKEEEDLIPFDVTIVMSDTDNNSTAIYSLDFIQNAKKPEILNVSELVGINGLHNVWNGNKSSILITQWPSQGKFFHTIDLLDKQYNSIQSDFVFPDFFMDCFTINGVVFAADNGNYLQHYSGYCDEDPKTDHLIVEYNSGSGDFQFYETLENSSVNSLYYGNSYFNDKYLFLRFERNTITKDFYGIAIFDRESKEKVYEIISPYQQVCWVSDNEILIQRLGESGTEAKLIELGTWLELDNFEHISFGGGTGFSECQYLDNKMNAFIFFNIDTEIPYYYDLELDKVITINREKFDGFFGKYSAPDYLDYSVKKRYVDLETNSALIHYKVAGLNGSETAYLLFMDFDGNAIYQYEVQADYEVERIF